MNKIYRESRKRCESCKIYHTEVQSSVPSCCSWYIDHVVLGDKSVQDCPCFKEVESSNDC